MQDDLRDCVRCHKQATWIVGFEEGFDEIYGITNDVCDEHVVECCRAMTDAPAEGDIPGRLTVQRLPFPELES